MKRIGVMIVAAGAMLLGACDRQESLPDYNPKVDGVMPPNQTPPDASILENQKHIYDTMVAANGGGGGAKPVTATAPATATAPGTGDVLTSPEGDSGATAPAVPAAPAGGEGVTPQPPKE